MGSDKKRHTEKRGIWREQLRDLVEGPYDLYGGKKALAKTLHITEGHLRQFRKGRRRPSYEVAKRIEKLHKKQCPEVQADAPL